MNGGLISAPIGSCCIVPDDVKVDWTFEQWQQFARTRYDSSPWLTDIIKSVRNDNESGPARDVT